MTLRDELDAAWADCRVRELAEVRDQVDTGRICFEAGFVRGQMAMLDKYSKDVGSAIAPQPTGAAS